MIFFKDLRLPKPDFYLGAGSGSHTEQTAKIMLEFEKVLLKVKPDLVIVVGDVNSTIACSIVAVKLGVKVAHIEAGLRSFDRSMPEEINRILTDSISNYLFVTEKSGYENLIKEGVSKKKIFFVGNTMIDSLINYINKSDESKILNILNICNNGYILVTLHRPSLVDNNKNLKTIINLLNKLSYYKKIIFPVHPRTKINIEKNKLTTKLDENVIVCKPFGYIDFITLLKNASLVITDSGGIQEETTFLQVQCITLRQNTERPVTVKIGTNYLLKTNPEDFLSIKYLNKIKSLAVNLLNGKRLKKGKIPDKWDGKAGKRIVDILVKKLAT